MYNTISFTREEVQCAIDALQNWHELDSSHIDRKLAMLDSKMVLKMLQTAMRASTSPPNVMQPSDYMMQNVDGKELTVCAHFSGMGMTWPPYLTYFDGRRYKFNSNKAMRPWMAGEFSGCASYMECEVDNQS